MKMRPWEISVIKNVNPTNWKYWFALKQCFTVSGAYTMLWTSCSAFDFLVFAINFKLKVKNLKSWIALFPKTSFISFPVTGYWHKANQMVAPWQNWKAVCCSGSLEPLLLYPQRLGPMRYWHSHAHWQPDRCLKLL